MVLFETGVPQTPGQPACVCVCNCSCGPWQRQAVQAGCIGGGSGGWNAIKPYDNA
jgi:hypothetical protein